MNPIQQAIEALEVAQDALDISQSLQESAKSNHHPKTLAAYQRVSAALTALREAVKQEPVGFMSEKQLALIEDPEGEHGRYIPIRKTPAGNFTFALYTTPQAPEAEPVLLSDAQVEAGAKALAKEMDYPWAHMPEKGRNKMRDTVRNVLARAVEAEVIRRGGGV